MKKFQEIEEAIEVLKKEMEQSRKEFTEKGSKLFFKSCKEIFDIFPDLKSFSWSQYTPYFNDGDECIFGVNDVEKINGYCIDDYDNDDENENKEINIIKDYNWKEEESDKKAFELVNTLRNFISNIPDEILKEIYGDHCKVTIYHDGSYNVNEYDHD